MGTRSEPLDRYRYRLISGKRLVQAAGRRRRERPDGRDSTQDRKAVNALLSSAISYFLPLSDNSSTAMSGVMMSNSVSRGARRSPT